MEEIAPATWYGTVAFIVLGLFKLYFEVKKGNKTTERVLILTDGRMTVALKNIARLSRALARQTKDPEDIMAADLAEEELAKKYIKDEEAHRSEDK